MAYIVLPGKYPTDLVLDIVLSGKEILLPTRSDGTYRPAPEAIQHHSAPSRACESSPKSGCLAHIVLPGKLYRPLREMLGLCVIVLPGNSYRPGGEALPSRPGTNLVLRRKVYRFAREGNAEQCRPLAEASPCYGCRKDLRRVRLAPIYGSWAALHMPRSGAEKNTDLSRKIGASRTGSVQGRKCRDGYTGRQRPG